jgi:negative regulator of replication initiation
MKMYKIEVDEEVYRYLQKKAEPFVDTVNSTIRRELSLGPTASVARGESRLEFPDIPKRIPDGLGDILKVTHLVKKYSIDRIEATREVAKRRNIMYPTVADKYARQLGKSAHDIDTMLDEPGFLQLKRTLKEKYHRYSDYIDEFFNVLECEKQT